jgi:hypothetical protein
MPRLACTIGPSGPVIDSRLWIGPADADALKAAGIPHPPTCSVPALLDTGAEMTAIHRPLAEWLGSDVQDWMKLRSSVLGAGEREAPVYEIRMTFGPWKPRTGRSGGRSSSRAWMSFDLERAS